MKEAEVKIIEETIIQACQPLSKEDLIPAMFASVMSYAEVMGWGYTQTMGFVTETFGWLNKLKVKGTLEQVMRQKRRTAIYTR